ncbi:MAG: hypothetical protein ACI8RZ_007318 [Myxococcota bacterium]|jgi:hypothetical protein
MSRPSTQSSTSGAGMVEDRTLAVETEPSVMTSLMMSSPYGTR